LASELSSVVVIAAGLAVVMAAIGIQATTVRPSGCCKRENARKDCYWRKSHEHPNLVNWRRYNGGNLSEWFIGLADRFPSPASFGDLQHELAITSLGVPAVMLN
jgi:hypothetical protein